MGRSTPEPICDFCSAPDPTWSFPAESFYMTALDATSTGEWLACDECAELVAAGDWNGLAERSLTTKEIAYAIENKMMTHDFAIRMALVFHQGFHKHRRGNPVPIRPPQ